MTLLHTGFCAALVLFNYKDCRFLSFDATNSGAFFFWQFVPVTLAVIPGLIWEIIFIEVCRSQPYRDLATFDGTTLKDSLSQTYLTSFSWFVPYFALQHPKKHVVVAASAMAYILSYGVLPTVTVAMIKINWDSSVSTGTVQPLIYFLGMAAGVSMATAAFGIVTAVILSKQKSGLYGNPTGIAGLGALITDSNLLKHFQTLHTYDSQDRINQVLGDLRLGFEQSGSSYQIDLLEPNQTFISLPEVPWRRNSHEAHPRWLRGKTYLGLNLFMLLPIIGMYIALSQQINTAVDAGDPTKINGDTLIIRICSAILAVANATIFANWHLNVAILQPFHELADLVPTKLPTSSDTSSPDLGPGSSTAIRMDYTGSAISNLLRPGKSFSLWIMAIGALLTQLQVIIRPASTSNLAFAVALSDSSVFGDVKVPAGVRPLNVILYVDEILYFLVFVACFIDVMRHKRQPFMPRKPYTLSSTILYLCHSTDLLQDLKGLSMFSKEARDDQLEANGHKYAFGWIPSEDSSCATIGVERLEHVKRQFKYPKSDPDTMTQQHYQRIRGETDAYKTRRQAGWPQNAH